MVEPPCTPAIRPTRFVEAAPGTVAETGNPPTLHPTTKKYGVDGFRKILGLCIGIVFVPVNTRVMVVEPAST